MSQALTKIKKIWFEYDLRRADRKIDVPQEKISDFVATMLTPGPSYFYTFDFATLGFDYVQPRVKDIVGVNPEDASLQLFSQLIHPEDLEHFSACELAAGQFLFKEIPPEHILDYKISYCYRMKMKDQSYKMVLQQTRGLSFDENYRISKVFGVHTLVDHLIEQNNKQISFTGLNGRPSYWGIDVHSEPLQLNSTSTIFSPRQLDVVRLLADGLGNHEIAQQLGITFETVRTHRKKILEKSQCKNTVHVIAKCIREGVI